MSNTRVARIIHELTTTFQPQSLRVIDESHLHRGHVGSQDGKGHFAIEIQASIFAAHSLIENHRLIYSALAELMKTDIHALCIKILPGV